MANVFKNMGTEVGRQVIREAVKVGKEAWDESSRKNTRFSDELKDRAEEQLATVTTEARGIFKYLTDHPLRAVIAGAAVAVFALALYREARATRPT